MPPNFSASTGLMTLDEVISRLSKHPAVDGIVVLGSAARGQLTPSSDYDVLVVLSEQPVPLYLIVTQVDQRFSEFYFATSQAIDRLRAEKPLVAHTDSREALLARWLLAGQIAFDRMGRLAQTRNQLQLSSPQFQMWDEKEMYNQWFRTNYNLHQTKRLLRSNDPVELISIDLRLLYGLSDLMVNYFRFRGIEWKGEKEAIRFWQASDPQYLALFQQCLAETDRPRKLELWEQLSELTTAPLGGLWPEKAVVAQLDSNNEWKIEMLETALQYWESLLAQP